MKRLLLKNALIIDSVRHREFKGDILIENCKIKKVAEEIEINDREETRTIDLEGKVVTPGMIDMHVHLREPGEENKETIATGTKAAAYGGFTAIACMPNTYPAADNEATIELIKRRAEEAGNCRVLPVGCLTKERQGEIMAEYGFLKDAGVVALSDDGNSVMNSEVMRHCMEYATLYDLPVLSHCEDENLAEGGQIHEGYYSTILGLQGIPAAAEEIMIARDIALAELTGARLHICHISTKGGVELVRRAKEKGLKVTAEAAPHHFSLSDQETASYNTATKVNPPLRSEEHIQAVIAGLKDGTIDVIASDHAPHSREEKEVEYPFAPFGISGVETCLAVSLHYLYHTGKLSLRQLVEKFTTGPASVLGINIAGIEEGSLAHLTVFDPELVKEVNLKNWHSLGQNTPYAGKNLKGWPVMTIVGGKITAESLT